MAWGILRTAMLSALGIIILFPVLYSLSVAARPANELYDPLVTLIPRHFTMDNIKNAISYLQYPTALLNSIALTGLSTILQVASCALAGYGLARFRFKGRRILFAMVVLVIVVPPQTVIIPNYVQFRYFDPLGILSLAGMVLGQDIKLNLIDSNMAFFLPAAFAMGIRSGIVIFIFRQFFRGMPGDLEEAAAIDGCSALSAFIRIMAPNATGATLTAFLFSFVWYWNDYVHVTSYLSNAKTVMNQLYRLKDNIGHIMQYEISASPYEGILLLQAGVLLSIVPLLAMYAAAQRHFTESIERSGIVG
jgi:multiple sugar transport system permease protein